MLEPTPKTHASAHEYSLISGQDGHDVIDRYQISTCSVWFYLRQHGEQGAVAAPQ